MMRWIISICAVGVCACAPGDFAVAETDDDAATTDEDGAVQSDAGVGGPGDASPGDVARLEAGHDGADGAAPPDAGDDTKNAIDAPPDATPDAIVPSSDTATAPDTVVAPDVFDSGAVCAVPGKCDDGNACTADGCDPDGGCAFTRIDADGDLASPRSLGACGLDCNDADARAKPGQLTFFTTPTAAGSFDYNCDGTEERQLATLGYCYYDDAGFCVFKEGFIISAPKCGEAKQYVTACNLSGEGCYPAGAVFTQACR